MSKKITSLISIVLCVALVVTNVHAYPVQDSEYPVTTTPAAENESLSSVETVVWQSGNVETQHGYSPAICIADKESTANNIRLIVTYDVSAERGEIKYSDDGGATFQKVGKDNIKDPITGTSFEKFIFGRPFKTRNATSGKNVLYIVARSAEGTEEDTTSAFGNLIMLKSTDNGKNWSGPYTIATGRWHSAPTEIVTVKENNVDYVYMTWDLQNMTETANLGGAGRGVLAPIVMKARADADLEKATSWTYSGGIATPTSDEVGADPTASNPMTYYDAIGGTNSSDGNTWDKVDYMGVPFHHYRYASIDNGNVVNQLNQFGWLEGNIVRITDTNNVLYDPNAVCHIYLRSSAGTSDYANVMKVVKDAQGNMVSEMVTTPSGKNLLYVQLPGGQSKFYITYDETSKKYWMVSNVSADSMAKDATVGADASTSRHEGPQDVRNELGLFYSSNAMDWNFAGYVSRTDDIDQARSYASMVIGANDLLIVSRSGDAYAQSAHNNNQIVFHRVTNFRNLATQTSVADGGSGTILANSGGTAYYGANILEDDSVADINTYITKMDTTIVTCSVSDEDKTESKVLVKNADGFYAQTLTTSYKLGEPFEANNKLYVFGVSDKELVGFQSEDEGMTWEGPYTMDKTRNWNEAPTSAIVKDGKIMLALSEIGEGTYWPIRGYIGDGYTYDNESKMWTLSGYGAMGYTEAFDLDEGDSIVFDIEPKTLISGVNNAFGLAFLDAPTFWGNEADYGQGFVVSIQTNNDYADNVLQFYTSYMDQNGNSPNTPNLTNTDERIGKKGLTQLASDKRMEVKFTKCTQTIDDVAYAWTISVTYTMSNGTKETVTKNIPASQVPANKFASGLYFAAGARNSQNIEYKISNLRVEDNKWMAHANYATNDQPGTITGKSGDLTIDGTRAAYYQDKVWVQEGTKISMDVQIPTVVETGTVQYALGITTGLSNFYNQGVDSSNKATTMAVEFTSTAATADAVASPLRVGLGYRLPETGRTAPASTKNLTERADITKATYGITFEKQKNNWKVTVKDTYSETESITEMEDSTLGDGVFSNGAYIIIGAMNTNTNQLKVSNLTVTQPEGFAVATADSNKLNRISPVVMTASLSSDLTDENSWTYSEGTSFVEKIGNVYTNTRFNYFGLPYTKADVRNIGWSDLKLIKVDNTDDIRYDKQTGNVYGYMTLSNAGYNYAAFVKVNTETNQIEFFTPPALTEGVKEEEMVFAKLPGGNNGFEILYDELFGRYWLVTTVNTDTTNKTDKSASKIALYYSANAYDWIYAGTVADGLTGDARVSAEINDDDLFITATGAGGVVNYTVSAFRDLVRTDRWSLIRGYNEAAGTGTMTNGENKVTLAGYGGAACDAKIFAKDDTEISFVLKPTDLPENSWFSVGLIDTKGSFFGNDTDKGNGFQITIKPWSDVVGGAQILYNYIVNGESINPVEGSTEQTYPFVGGKQMATTLKNRNIEFKFVKLSNGNWCVNVKVDADGETYVLCQEIPVDTIEAGITDETKRVLFENGAYLIAGGSNGVASTCEISDMKVRQPVLGDVNDDGEINALDFVATDFRYRKDTDDKNVYTAYEQHIYDIDKNGKCDVEDVKLLRSMVLGNKNTTQAVSADTETPGKVRLERRHYKVDGVDMTDVTINTNFVCGGLEGLFLYDDTKLTYKKVTCETSEVAGVIRNEAARTISIDEKGTMVTALGKVKEGTKGNMVTLTFEGIWEEDFDMTKDIFTNAEGTEHKNVKFYDVMLGNAHDEDYEIDVRDLVKMSKQEGNACTEDGQYMNSDCNRDDAVSEADTNLLMNYLVEIITRF